ncbi:MAG: 2-oxo-4-hydroxy-4-carboxy-5-ureidoimidazoline decarboxylase [Aeromicrobium sp.]
MDLDTFNALAPDAAVEVVRPCADVPAWIGELVDGRPYDDLGCLLTFAEAAAAAWDDTEIDAALAHHPRIGERPDGDDPEAQLSRSEQAALGGGGPDLARAMAAGNRAYEQLFGRIFLIRAAGRTSAEVLEQLTERLDNDPVAETAVVAGQLREIALLRLEGIFAP